MDEGGARSQLESFVFGGVITNEEGHSYRITKVGSGCKDVANCGVVW